MNASVSKTPYATARVRMYLRMLLFLFLDVLTIIFSGFFALWIRADASFDGVFQQCVQEQVRITPYMVLTFVIIYFLFRLYHSVWRFASVSELARIVGAYIAIVPVGLLEIWLLDFHLPRSTYFIAYTMDFLFCVLIRFSYRTLRYYTNRRRTAADTDTDQVMVIGAGAAARELIADIATSTKVRYQVVCIIDDNPALSHRYLGNIPIVGTRDDIIDAVEKYQVDRIIFAIPTATKKERADILNICKDTGCHLQVMPGLYQLVNGEVSVTQLKDVDVIDLLGRGEIRVNNDEIFEELHNKVVLVTGGGGSIGSELCRQIAKAEPEMLILFDIYENTTYDIENELKRAYPSLDLVVLIGSVRNTNRVEWLFDTYRPDIVYHAAAHKHVPLMEESPNEAVKNNCLGTLKIATAAAEHKVKRFLLISTDKAVNPTNVMGASKRICEMIIQTLDRKYEVTTFCAVRFGNVLGSNGSVIPLFRKQIAAGGPVTVTHPDIIRYFMTIPEAVSLVLQASIYAKGGEIFVFDMGEPVRIDDMARRMIELSGYTPDEDIEIKYTGLRPGEKLYEELLLDREKVSRTANDLIFIEPPYPMDDKKFEAQLKELGEAATSEVCGADIRELIHDIVETYHEE